MHCLGFPAGGGLPALVVVMDEALYNEGASATNSIETVLLHLRKRWAGLIDVEKALVVERDSEGAFDHTYPNWGSNHFQGHGPSISWLPLRWPGITSRTEAAFVAMFGQRARVALDCAGSTLK